MKFGILYNTDYYPAAHGSPSQYYGQILAQEYYGVNYMIFEVAQGGEPHELVVQSLERFAKYVMPAFREGK